MKESTKKITSAEYTLFHSLQDVFPRLPPSSAEHVIAIEDVELFHSGCLWKSMWAIMMERERGGGGGRERKEKKKKVPEGFWGPAKQLNGCKQHHSPHVQTFKISAHVMGSVWPLSGCTEHRRSLPSEVYRTGWLGPHQGCGLMSKDRRNFDVFILRLHPGSIAFATFQPVVFSLSGLNYTEWAEMLQKKSLQGAK